MVVPAVIDMELLLCLLLSSSNLLLVNINAMRLQGVGVRGQLFCGSKPLNNTRVRIYDVDRLPGDQDDLLREGFTDDNGEFRLDGTTREMTSIEPRLVIYHNCDDGIRPCERRVPFDIPKEYIHKGTVRKWYDIGELNMRNTFPDEGRVCDYQES